MPVSSDVREARQVLTGKRDLEHVALVALAKRLKADNNFAYARRLFERARHVDPQLRTEQALCTYKDPELPIGLRLDAALRILDAPHDRLKTERWFEALGIAGAIHKARWQWDARPQHLITSLAYYERGSVDEATRPEGQGYCAINAAFVLDILATLEPSSSSAPARRTRADDIRRDIVTDLTRRVRGTDVDWWVGVTLVEALLGLGDFRAATAVVSRMPDPETVAGWQVETMVRQVESLARMRFGPGSSNYSMTMDLLESWLGGFARGLRATALGKVGLALSGGGFRASFFHLGVLAYLADKDMLRHVQVLSCVSGGSIAGAQYYLRLRGKLNTKRDHEMTRREYQEIVEAVIEDFRAGVGSNIRVRLLSDPVRNLALLISRGRSRTTHVAQLLSSELHRRVLGRKDIAMRELTVSPAGEPGFEIRDHNWRRSAKVPILILNATTLNTGHLWQFTASSIGEPASPLSADVDMNTVLRRAWYEDLPEKWQRFPLSSAVAASACVPGLFAPLVLEEIYPGQTVKLVDGGVHDNQGIAGLLDQDCTVLLISDASGQMADDTRPSGWFPRVLKRSSGITMARVRASQYESVRERRAAGVVSRLVSVHLRSGLERRVVPALRDIPDPLLDGGDAAATVTPYGVNAGLQRSLAEMRTDLDAFSDAEAFALMQSGYQQMALEAAPPLADFDLCQEPPADWPFFPIGRALDRPDPHPDLASVLRASSALFFRSWVLWRVPKAVITWAPPLLLVVAAALIGVGALQAWNALDPDGLLEGAGVAAAGVVALVLTGAVVVALVARLLAAPLVGVARRRGAEKHIGRWAA